MEPLLGDMELFPYGFAPRDWMECAGQTLSIVQNQALYSIIGTKFGGDGRSTFRLPDIPQDKCPYGMRYYICTYGSYPPRN